MYIGYKASKYETWYWTSCTIRSGMGSYAGTAHCSIHFEMVLILPPSAHRPCRSASVWPLPRQMLGLPAQSLIGWFSCPQELWAWPSISDIFIQKFLWWYWTVHIHMEPNYLISAQGDCGYINWYFHIKLSFLNDCLNFLALFFSLGWKILDRELWLVESWREYMIYASTHVNANSKKFYWMSRAIHSMSIDDWLVWKLRKIGG